MEEFSGDVGVVEDEEAVGLVDVGGELGEKPIRPDANGAAHMRADTGGDASLEVEGEAARAIGRVREVFRELALEFVDRLHFFHRHAGLDDGFEAAVVVDVDLGSRLDDDDAGAEAARLGDAAVALEAEFFGVGAEGDEAGGLGEHGDDADGFAAQLGPLLLFDGGEERIEIDGEIAERHGGETVAREPARANVEWSGRGRSCGCNRRDFLAV